MTVPDHVRARHDPPLECYYCARAIAPERGTLLATHVAAQVTMHDGRGCAHVCFGHAQWRMEHSFLSGHSPDCPYWRAP